MNQRPTNQSHNNQQENNKQGHDSSSRADQPTPVSASSQAQGSHPGQADKDLKQAGRELAHEAQHAAKHAVSNATEEVKHQVSDLTQAAQEQATQFLGEQKGMAAERIGGVAEALRQAGQGFAERDEGTLAHYTDSFADQLDRFSTSLRDREIGSLLDDAKQLAHRQPELFVAGALAAGFALGRFFKSSRHTARMQDDYSYEQYGYGRDYNDPYSYDRFDPRDRSRSYGEPYGQRYGDQFNRSRGPEVSRGYESSTGSSPSVDRAPGATSAGKGYSQNTGRSARQNLEQSHNPNEQIQQTARNTSGTAQQYSQAFGQGEEQVSNYKGNESKPASDVAKRPNEREDKEIR